MLKKRLGLISFGFLVLFFYEKTQASDDSNKIEDYSADFIDTNSLSEALSNIDDTTVVDRQDYQERDYENMIIDKREDHDFLERIAFHEEQIEKEKKLLKLQLLVMKRLQSDELPLTISAVTTPDNDNKNCNSFKNSESDIELLPMVYKVFSIENVGELSSYSSESTIFTEMEQRLPIKLELQNIEDDSDHVEL